MGHAFRRLRGNILKALLILLILFISLIPARFINSIYGYFPAFCIILLLAVSLAFLFVISRSVGVEIDTPRAECMRGEKINVTLKVVNKSFLICPKARAYLYLSDLFGGDDTVTPALFTMAGKSSSEFSFDLRMNHIGTYQAGVKMMRIYDLLGVFSVTVMGNKDFEVTVLPKLFSLEDMEISDDLQAESQDEHKSAQSDGFDYTGVREYVQGDSMKRIHWKLSAHSKDYMTKITEISRLRDLTVAIDFIAPRLSNGALLCLNDRLIETGLSLIEHAAQKQIDYSLIFAGRNREITRVIPKGGNNYSGIISLFPVIRTVSDNEMPNGASILTAESKMNNRSSNIIMCSANVTEELIQELVSIKQQQREPLLYYIIPYGLNSREREKLAAPLRILDECDIVYHIVTAEAEI